jgi:hypothetical protein
MLRSRGATRATLPGLLIPFLFLAVSCAGEEATTQEQSDEAAALRQQETEAELALAAALAEAEKDDRLVFLHTGADW